MRAERGGKMGKQTLTKTKVLPDILHMKEFSLADASLLYLGPGCKLKSAERVRGRETCQQEWQTEICDSYRYATNKCVKEKVNPTSNQGLENQRDTIFTDLTGCFLKNKLVAMHAGFLESHLVISGKTFKMMTQSFHF